MLDLFVYQCLCGNQRKLVRVSSFYNVGPWDCTLVSDTAASAFTCWAILLTTLISTTSRSLLFLYIKLWCVKSLRRSQFFGGGSRWCLVKCACACHAVSYGDSFQNVGTVGNLECYRQCYQIRYNGGGVQWKIEQFDCQGSVTVLSLLVWSWVGILRVLSFLRRDSHMVLFEMLKDILETPVLLGQFEHYLKK